MPLDVLSDRVDAWIAEQKGSVVSGQGWERQ